MSGLQRSDVDKIDVGLWTGSYEHAPLARLARDLGGMCTKKFNQGMTGWAAGLKTILDRLKERDGDNWQGACWGMSVIWITFHANDRDFWGYLYGEPVMSKNPYGDMDRTAAATIVGFHGVISGRTFTGNMAPRDSGTTQDQYVDNWLTNKGLVRDGGGDAKKRGVGGGANNLVSYILQGKREAYKLVTFWPQGNKTGHMCAVWVGDDVTWFDANIGEFWFPNQANFRTWFNEYWSKLYVNSYATFECRAFRRPLSMRRP